MDLQPEFKPARFFGGGHRQTLAGSLPRRIADLQSEVVELTVDDDTRIRLRCNWQPDPAAPTLVLVHGLTGDSDAPYLRGTAEKAIARGISVVRVDIRNCGETESWTLTTYQAGLTQDLRAVLEWIHGHRPSTPTVAGWSLGGNMTLKLAGELGNAATRLMRSVVAVCPAIELAPCADLVDARGFSSIYRRFFLKQLRKKLRTKHEHGTARFGIESLDEPSTMRDFDDRFTAKQWHYRGVDEYYARASALPWLPKIRVPSTLIHALDDPLVPASSFTRPEVLTNDRVRVLSTTSGGHCSFFGRRNGTDPDRWWIENRILDLCEAAHAAATR